MLIDLACLQSRIIPVNSVPELFQELLIIFFCDFKDRIDELLTIIDPELGDINEIFMRMNDSGTKTSEGWKFLKSSPFKSFLVVIIDR